MAVVLYIRVCIAVTFVLSTQDSFKPDVLRLFRRERLELIQRILPVELSTLLLPLMIGLHLLLLLVDLAKFSNFIDGLRSLSLGLFSEFNELLNFITDTLIILRHSVLDNLKLLLDRALNGPQPLCHL